MLSTRILFHIRCDNHYMICNVNYLFRNVCTRQNERKECISKEVIHGIIKEARVINFPWDSIPSLIRDWLKAMGGATNTHPEFLIVASLTVVSCLLGTDTVFRVGERH